jgi:hypothetical protein
MSWPLLSAGRVALAYTDYGELPDGSVPAEYYWSLNHARGFGPGPDWVNETPGYILFAGYGSGETSSWGQGHLAKSPGELLKLFSSAENAALEKVNPWQQIRSVVRTSPFEVYVSGWFPATWDATVWYRSGNSERVIENYAKWNSLLYSSRACRKGYEGQPLLGADGTPVEYF